MNEYLSDEIVSIRADRDAHAAVREKRVEKAFPVIGAGHPTFNRGPHRVVETFFPIDIFAAPGPVYSSLVQARHKWAALGIIMRKKAALHHVDTLRTRLFGHAVVPLEGGDTMQLPLPVALIKNFLL